MTDPKRVGPWQVEGRLGVGGNAIVYRASREGTEVALKVLRGRDPSSEPYRRFRDEVGFMRRHLGQPGMLPLIDADVPANTPRGTRPWLATPIAVPIRAALGPEPTLAAVVTAVLAHTVTLRDLATQGVHHRDLKPENLFLLDGQWVLGDFGLVTYPGKESLTAPARHIGPVFYLAPELLQDATKAAPEPAAVYALAKIIWVLGSRQNYPLQGPLGNAQFALASLVSDPRAPLLDTLLEAATTYDPATRPRLAELVVEMEAWLAAPAPPRTPGDMTELKGRLRTLVSQGLEVEQRRKELVARAETTANEVKRIGYAFEGVVRDVLPWSVSATSSGSVVRRAPHLGVAQPELSDGVDLLVLPPWNDSPRFHLFTNVQLVRPGRLLIAGGCAIEVGGNWYLEWSDRWDVIPGSAAEQAALRALDAGLHDNLERSITAFAESVRSHAQSK